MNKTGKRLPGLTSGVLSRLAAGAITLPFLFALPSYVDPDRTWWNIGLGALIAAGFVVAQFVAHRLAQSSDGSGLVYNADAAALMVNHPPTPPSGLTLDELLGYANRLNPQLALWLDVKNLDETNVGRVLDELNRLDARHAIRSRALVETGHTGPAAAMFRQAGFLSSYYLPTAVVTQRAGVGSGAASSCQGAPEIQRVVEAGRFAAVSYDWRGRQWVGRCLGLFVRKHRLRSYAWDLAPMLSNQRAHERLDDERLRGYSAVAAVLLPFRSVFDDWR